MSGAWVEIVGIVLWTLLASQHAFYAVGFEATQRALGAAAYVELRNQIDLVLRRTLPALYVATLAWTLALLVRGGSGRGAIAVALGALLVEVWLMLKRSLPINALMQSWTADAPPPDWSSQRSAWLAVFHRRQAAVAVGFLSLLIGALR